VGVYVDDVIVTGASDEIITMFKLEMQQQFQMSDLGLLSSYLGIEVNQGPADITLCQAAYRRKILEKCGMVLCKSTAHSARPCIHNRVLEQVHGGSPRRSVHSSEICTEVHRRHMGEWALLHQSILLDTTTLIWLVMLTHVEAQVGSSSF
jgi:hypothetical protein